MGITSEDVHYSAAGVSMQGRLFRGSGERVPQPGVLVYPDGFGLGAATYDAARRFADLGYAALACDLYGDAFRGEGPTAEVKARNQRILSSPGGLRSIGVSAFEVLRTRADVDATRIAAAGYCFGGTIALDLAFSHAPVRAAAAFHPSFNPLQLTDVAGTRARLHVFVGAEDYAAPTDSRAAFEAALAGKGVRWRMTIYGGVKHAFTTPDCPGMGDKVAYDAAADRDSWDVTVAMFKQAFAETV